MATDISRGGTGRYYLVKTKTESRNAVIVSIQGILLGDESVFVVREVDEGEVVRSEVCIETLQLGE